MQRRNRIVPALGQNLGLLIVLALATACGPEADYQAALDTIDDEIAKLEEQLAERPEFEPAITPVIADLQRKATNLRLGAAVDELEKAIQESKMAAQAAAGYTSEFEGTIEDYIVQLQAQVAALQAQLAAQQAALESNLEGHLSGIGSS